MKKNNIISLILIFMPIIIFLNEILFTDDNLIYIFFILVSTLELLRKKSTIVKGIFFISYLLFIFLLQKNNILIDGKYYLQFLYFLNFTLFMIVVLRRSFVNDLEKNIKRNINLICNQIHFIFIILTYLLVTGKGFKRNWDMNYFKGFSRTQHTFSYLAISLAILCIYIFLNRKKNIYLLYSIVLCGMVILSGARSSLIFLFIIGLGYIYIDRLKLIKLRYIIVIIVTLGIIFSNSQIIDKTLREKSISNYNGRIDISRTILNEYRNLNTFEKTLGVGGDKVYLVTQRYLNNSIWAHNDFIQILYGFGLVGLVILLIVYLKLFKLLKQWGKDIAIILTFSILILANINGVFNYKEFTLFIPYYIIFITSIKEYRYNSVKINY